eukprot:scaffold154964_cov37-Prasinocladus_malaysianus.AAC.1
MDLEIVCKLSAIQLMPGTVGGEQNEFWGDGSQPYTPACVAGAKHKVSRRACRAGGPAAGCLARTGGSAAPQVGGGG